MMKGIEFAEVRDALATSFNADEFDMFLYARLNFDRPSEVADGPFKKVVTDVLRRFEQEGRDPYLIAEVAAVRPLRADVQEVYKKYAHALVGEAWQQTVEAQKLKALERYGLAPTVELQRAGKAQLPTAVPVTHEGFQKWVNRALPHLNAWVWAAQLIQQMRRVCQVVVDERPEGTGFLVGPDAVLTNYHVLQAATRGRLGGGKVVCKFEYWLRPDGTEADSVQVRLKPAFDDWHLDSSPPLEVAAEHAGIPAPTADQLDHALVVLERKIGDEPIYEGGPVRGWVRLPGTAPTLSPQMPMTILQHPKAQPMKLAFDTEAVLSVNGNRTRVRYKTNTEDGSSGSPCFNVNWGLIALHHFGEPNKNPATYNQGIPIDKIRERLVRTNKAQFLGGDSP